MVVTSKPQLTGMAWTRPPASTDSRYLKESPSAREYETMKAGAGRAKFQLAWALVRNKKFQEEYKKNMGISPDTPLSSQQIYELAIEIMDNNTPESIEEAISNLQQEKASMKIQYGTAVQPSTGGAEMYNKMREAIETVTGQGLQGKSAADAVFERFMQPPSQISPGVAGAVQPVQPEAVQAPAPEPGAKMLPTTGGGYTSINPEDLKKMVKRIVR